MLNQQIKDDITNSLKALKDANDKIRIEAVKRLGEIGFSHEQIIGALESLTTKDPSPDVRDAARNVISILNNAPRSNSSTINTSLPDGKSYTVMTERDDAILELLRQQNELMKNIQILLSDSLEKDGEKTYRIRSRIVDIDMSISSMIGLSFKWLVASIPVGIVIGVLWSTILRFFFGFY